MPAKYQPETAYCSNNHCKQKDQCLKAIEIRPYQQHIRVQHFDPDLHTGECRFFEKKLEK